MSEQECGATLWHAHGVAVCDLPPGPGHERQHGAWCDSCVESGDDARLRWDRDCERWTP